MPSRQVGDLCMEELSALDQIAYVRFASVYRQFEDVNALRDEIERLQEEPSPEARRRQMHLIKPDND